MSAPGYVSPYGKMSGLRDRVADWVDRLGTDRALPWAGLGLIADLEAVLKILNLREFAEHLRLTGTAEQRQFADDILRNEETLEGVTQALADGGLRNYDQVAGVETLSRERDAAVREIEGVRTALIQVGALPPGDTDTPILPLLRVLLS